MGSQSPQTLMHIGRMRPKSCPQASALAKSRGFNTETASKLAALALIPILQVVQDSFEIVLIRRLRLPKGDGGHLELKSNFKLLPAVSCLRGMAWPLLGTSMCGVIGCGSWMRYCPGRAQETVPAISAHIYTYEGDLSTLRVCGGLGALNETFCFERNAKKVFSRLSFNLLFESK